MCAEFMSIIHHVNNALIFFGIALRHETTARIDYKYGQKQSKSAINKLHIFLVPSPDYRSDYHYISITHLASESDQK